MGTPDHHGNDPSWPQLVRRLLLHARALGASLEEAEDLVHDALEVTLADPDWYDPDRGKLLSALKVVVRNRYFNRVRHRKVHQKTTPRLKLVEPEATPDVHAQAADARELRRALLARLDRDERAVFRAWLQQRSGAVRGPDAAASVGRTMASYEAAKKRLRRRLKALVDELGIEATDLFGPASVVQGASG